MRLVGRNLDRLYRFALALHFLVRLLGMPRRRLIRSTTRLERAAIKLRRFLHPYLGGTGDWPIKFTGSEEHTPELCRLINELRQKMERAATDRALQIHCRL